MNKIKKKQNKLMTAGGADTGGVKGNDRYRFPVIKAVTHTDAAYSIEGTVST